MRMRSTLSIDSSPRPRSSSRPSSTYAVTVPESRTGARPTVTNAMGELSHAHALDALDRLEPAPSQLESALVHVRGDGAGVEDRGSPHGHQRYGRALRCACARRS